METTRSFVQLTMSNKWVVQQTGMYVVYVTYVCIMSQGVYKVLLVLVVSDTLIASGQAK